MAGVLLIFMGVTGLGSAVRYIPRPVTIGFTNGIALLIASTQIKDFFGLTTPSVPSEFIAKMRILAFHFGSINWISTALGVASLVLILVVPRLTKRIPGSIVALVLGTIATAVLHLPVATIGSKFGGIPIGFPHLAVPAFRCDYILPLLPSALTVALLGAIESLLSAVVADGMSGDKHNSNMELIAQGIANLASPLVGGIPATGAIARTATNIKSGAKTPVAGIVHAFTLLLILLFAAPAARFVPLCTLGAVLFVVAYNMGHWQDVARILRLSKADKAVWAATFLLTVVADLTVAVEVGMILASLLYIYRVSETTTVARVTKEYINEGRSHILQDKKLPGYITILRIHGPFLFGATEKLLEETQDLSKYAPVILLRLRNMTAIDATGVYALRTFASRLRLSGKTLLLCGARDQPAQVLAQSDFVQQLGPENILPNVESALFRAKEIYDGFNGIGEESAKELARLSL
jgi:SulP family sulfate permease